MTYFVNGVECEAATFEQLQKDNKEVGLDTVLLPDYNIALVLLVIPKIKYVEVFTPLTAREDGLYDRNINHVKLNIELKQIVDGLKEEVISKHNRKKNLVNALKEYIKK